MSDVWESAGLVTEVWESNTTPGVLWTVVIRDGDIVATVSDEQLAEAIANGAVVLAVTTVDVPAENYGGVFDGNTLTIAGAAGSAAGTYLLYNQTVGTNNDLWTHDGTGTFTRQTPGLALSRVGTLVVSQNTLAAAIAAGLDSQVFRVTGANEVEELVVTAGQVQALIDAAGAEAQHDYRAHEERLGLLQAPQFRKGAGDGQDAAWTSPADAVPTTSYGILFTGRVDELRGASWFHECMHRGMDAGVGAADSIELAIREWDGATYPTGSDELPPEGALWLYAEGTNQASGEAWESGDPLPETWQINVDADIRLGCWFTVLMWHNLTTGTVTLYREVDYGGVELVGRRWRQVAQIVEPVDAGSVYLDPAEPWACGVRFQGLWREAEIYIDGALAYAPRPDEYDPDSEGNTWATSTGTVEQSLDARVETLETATATVDVVSNVTGPSLLGRASGVGDSEELTAAQVQEMLGVPGVVLHRETLALDAAVKSYDVTGWAKIRVEFTGRGTRNATILGLLATLNGDTGNVYSTNAAALTSALTLGNLPGSSTNTNRRGMVNAEIDLTEGDYKEGLAWATNVGSTATVGQAPANVGLWSTITAEVTSIELKMQLDNIAAGARIRIIGLEAA